MVMPGIIYIFNCRQPVGAGEREMLINVKTVSTQLTKWATSLKLTPDCPPQTMSSARGWILHFSFFPFLLSPLIIWHNLWVFNLSFLLGAALAAVAAALPLASAICCAFRPVKAKVSAKARSKCQMSMKIARLWGPQIACEAHMCPVHPASPRSHVALAVWAGPADLCGNGSGTDIGECSSVAAFSHKSIKYCHLSATRTPFRRACCSCH